jgi:uncharacterized protein (TIGR02284 family)
MDTYTDELLDRLEDIAQKNVDAIRGYNKAAENSDNAGLQSYFRRKAHERRNFLTTLTTLVPFKHSFNIEDDDSFASAAHRAWMNIKTFFSGDDDEAMLEEAIRGDKAAIDDYDDLIKGEQLPFDLANLIRQQRERILQDIELNKSMEDVH